MNSDIQHDSTNKGPTVKPDEAADLRRIVTEVRKDGFDRMNVDVGLFERLVHTAEKRDG